MAAPVSWRIKGIDQATREMAVEAAARSGLSVGEWLERAIDNNVDIPLDDTEKPLVPADLVQRQSQQPQRPIMQPRAITLLVCNVQVLAPVMLSSQST